MLPFPNYIAFSAKMTRKLPTAIFFLLLLLLVCLNFSSSRAQIIRPNISLGTGITAGTNDTWRSINGDFAFGFFPLGGGGGNDVLYLLGIWFDRTPKPTLVWSANRDSPAPAGSTIRLTFAGQFFLTYANGSVQPIYTGEAAALGFMQDNGNMVLRDGNSEVMWESFGHPTDTILPTQTLASGGKLFSNSRGESDYSTGRFMLEMQVNDGNLVLSTYHFSDPGYWYTLRGFPIKNMSLLFNQTASLQLLNGTHHNIYSLTTNQIRYYSDYYHRVTIGDQGNLEQWAHHKTNNTGWVSIWKAIHEPCTVNGICGPYGMCVSRRNETATCQCIPGYIPRDPNNIAQGCRPETLINYCGGGGNNNTTTMTDNFTVTVIEDADFPFEGPADLTRVRNVDLEGCRRALIEDCYSHAAAFVVDSSSSRCIMKRMPLLNARLTSSTKGTKALVKVPLKISIVATSNPAVNGKNKRSKFNVGRFLLVGLISSATLALLSLFSALYYHPAVRRLVKRKRMRRSGNAVGITFTKFTYGELQVATKGFSHVIGRGSSATVYLGTLLFNDLQIDLAVKRLMETDMEKSDQEFATELKVIGRTHHKNLVRLLGFCVENNQRILVYERMSNGSISSVLQAGEKLSWDLRAQIVIGVARGLLYLHDQCAKQIIHCDIKPENILLDDDYTAKIADFGLSKLLKKEQTRTETNARGTAGYIAPEWLRNAPITSKVDVYSFGVVLLEMICCRRHIELHRVSEESEEEDLVLGDWVLSCVMNGKLEAVVSHDPEVVSDIKRFERMALVGLWCIHPEPFLRPSMKRIVQMVEGTVDVGIPPQLYDRMSSSECPHSL